VVIARRRVVGAESARSGVTGNCGRGALLGPRGRVACRKESRMMETDRTAVSREWPVNRFPHRQTHVHGEGYEKNSVA
jgi:hypothetical protein